MKKDKPLLSIIIISYNTKKITEDCLRSLYKSLDNNKFEFEIIVIDNVSKDGSVEMLKDFEKKHNNIQIILNKENVGFAKANNQGVRSANGEYILFLNSDIVVVENAIESLLDYYRVNEANIHFLGGKLLNKDLSPQPSCGPFYSLPVVFCALFLKGDYYHITRYSPDSPQEVDWVSGACILTKKVHYERVGGFDEKIFMYMDEIDLLYRAKKLGCRVFFYPHAVFIHLGSASSNKTYPILQVFKGFLYFYRKHHSPLAVVLLKVMLQLKSQIAILIGKLTNNDYLVSTYEEARRITEMD